MEKIIEFRNKTKQYPRLFRITRRIHPKTKKIIESFNIQESAFKKRNIIPFLARGIFINPEDNSVIVRGYDKFFNIGETEDTLWKNIEENTVGPFELTLKENGCIIFVSVYEDDLFVTSKHSFTSINNDGNLVPNNYSDLGEKWLDKYIKDKREQLKKFIKENNVTLVFELIDNDFEEHVLEYSKQEDGLYLHGINENTVEFKTWPSEKVNEVAKEFNLMPVKYQIYSDIHELKKFADSCNGYYNNKAIEGWVIRCKKQDGDTFFFKYKYEEPYLLYREWREVTKAYIDHKPVKCKYLKTYGYMEWIKQKYQTNKELFDGIKKKKGIIKLRKMYLDETNGGEYTGKTFEPVTKDNAKYKLILPIGIIGFGKTTVGRMLKILFDIGHIQSDNIQKKKPAPEFIANVCKEFDYKTIVMADKNNHLKRHRGELCEKLKEIYPNTLWIVALHWNIETVKERDILEFARERIEKRGENHQNLTPEKTANYPHIIKMFLNNYENLDIENNIEDSLIDEVIDVDFKEDSISIVKKIIKALNLEPKTDKELEDAFKQANELKSEIDAKAKKIDPLYYGIGMKYINCKELAMKYLKDYSDQHNEYIKDFEHLKFIIEEGNFLQREHVTIAHRKSDPIDMIKHYEALIGKTKQVMNFNNPDLEVYIHISSIVWTSNHAFIPVDKIESDKLYVKEEKSDNNNNNNESEKEEKKNDDELLYHITLASYGDVKPIECRNILQKINNYYKEHDNIKPEIINEEKLPLIDESYVIDDTNKDKENEIIHPKIVYQLLPSSIKNTTFMKPIKIVEGTDLKQLFIEPIKIKRY